MVRHFFLSLVLLAFAAPVLAHNPRAEVDDWGNFSSPYIIEDGTVSFAFFGALSPGDDLDVYQLTFAEDDTLRLELLIPVCGEDYVDYYPRILVLGAGDTLLSAGDLTVLLDSPGDAPAPTPTHDEPDVRLGDFPDDLSLLHTYDSRTTGPAAQSERQIFYERHTRRDYYETETIDFDVAAGDYTLVIHDPAQVGGAYLLASGYVETFFPPLSSEPDGVSMDWGSVWLRERCS